MVQLVVKDDRGNWIPPEPPKVVQDSETGLWRYQDPRLNAQGHDIFFDPVSRTLKPKPGTNPILSILGGGQSFEDTPGWLNLPIEDKINFAKAEQERRIKAAKKHSKFDRYFGPIVSIFTKFIPYVGTVVNKGVQAGLKRESEQTMEGLKRQTARSRVLLEQDVSRRREFALRQRQAKQSTERDFFARQRFDSRRTTRRR